MSAPIDPQGRVAAALKTAVDSYGAKVLSNPQMLSNLFKDLLPDAPRETNLLVTAAETGVASALTLRIDQQIPAGAAASDVASDLSDQRAMDLAACQWVTRQFAVALGYPVSAPVSSALSATPEAFRPPPPGPPPSAPGWPSSPSPAPFPPPAAPGPPRPAPAPRPAPPGPAWGSPRPPGPPPPSGPQPLSGFQPAAPYQPPRQRDRGPWIAGAVIVAVVIIAVIVLLVSGVFSGSSSAGSKPGTTPVVAPGSPAPTIPTTTGGARTLKSVLPPDVSAGACTTVFTPPTGFDTTHVIAQLHCDGPASNSPDPGLPGGSVFAYQFDSPAALKTGLVQYNAAKNFTPSTATGACPPANQNSEGQASWTNPSNTLAGTSECLYTSLPGSSATMLTYIWTVTQANAILEATGGTSQSAQSVHTWFATEASPR